MSDRQIKKTQKLTDQSGEEIHITGSRAETPASYQNRIDNPESLPEFRQQKPKSGFLEGTENGDVDLEHGHPVSPNTEKGLKKDL